MLKGRNFLISVVVLCLLVAIPVQAQSSDSKYFSETKHNVSGVFWEYYQSVSEAGALYGYPITEAFNSKDGNSVQYFQRARFEKHGEQIIVSALGSLTYQPGAQLNIYNPMACRTFDQTGYSVCFAFLEYFNQYGGAEIFGYPISPFEFQDGKIVQYFEKARMEWRPSSPNGQRVALTDLGSRYFQILGEDAARLAPAQPENALPISLLQLNVRAFAWKASTRVRDPQRIFIIVQDQAREPVRNATGTAIVTWTTGKTTSFAFTADENGIASFSFTIPEQPPGHVEVKINVERETLRGETVTSFSIWY